MSKSLSTKLRGVADKITNVMMNYSNIEAKVRAATNNEPWGPSGSLMQELAQYTYSFDDFPKIMGMLWYRLFHEGSKNWRKKYKSLIVLDYLLRYGSADVVNNTRENSRRISKLDQYTFYDKNKRDQGLNVRTKAREVMHLAADTERLRKERRRAKATRNNYVGFSYKDAKFKRTSAGVRQRSSFRNLEDVKPPEINKTTCRNITALGENDNNNVNDDEHAAIKAELVNKIEDKNKSTNMIDLGAAKHFTKLNNPSTPNLTTFETGFENLKTKPMNSTNCLEDGLPSQCVEKSFNQAFTNSDDFWDAKWTQLNNIESNRMEDANDPFLKLHHRFHNPPTTSIVNFTDASAPNPSGQVAEAGFANMDTIYPEPRTEVIAYDALRFSETAKLLEQNDTLENVFAETVDDKTKQPPSSAQPEANVVGVEHKNKELTCVKSNTWSDFEGFDVTLDNLKINCKYKEEKKLAESKKCDNSYSTTIFPSDQAQSFSMPVEIFHVLPKQIAAPVINPQNLMIDKHSMMMTQQYRMPDPSVFTAIPFVPLSFHRYHQNPINYQCAFSKQM